ncbi:MAG: hypothetical protein LiPW15_172 [Parcubacteria group bacterium LiPW_15]|nr:MAG: hypothetical protein LiPW15_172 [Parcubacteria group bacterium LiPW_15]
MDSLVGSGQLISLVLSVQIFSLLNQFLLLVPNEGILQEILKLIQLLFEDLQEQKKMSSNSPDPPYLPRQKWGLRIDLSKNSFLLR